MVSRNAFLAALSAADSASLSGDVGEVTLSVGQLLCESGELPLNVYFPLSSIISVVTVLNDGRQIEVSSVGFEGACGLLPAITGFADDTRTFVQVAGSAMKMPSARLRTRANDSPALTRLIARFAQVQHAQADQSVACNAVHNVSERLARWLLICLDRVDGPTLHLTQDYMGTMVAALRPSTSLAATDFRMRGLIRYKRGQVEILDRHGLERQACECYAADKANREKLLAAAGKQAEMHFSQGIRGRPAPAEVLPAAASPRQATSRAPSVGLRR